MKKILIAFYVCVSISSFAQSAEDYLNKGIDKESQQDYTGAIKEFTKAIEKNKKYTEAYYCRGTVKMSISDLAGALLDFNEAIKLSPNHIKALYNRAGIYANTQKYNESLIDLNKVIKIDEKFPSGLTLRGQIKTILNDNEGGCKDFNRAKEIGDQDAKNYISKYCDKKDIEKEYLSLNWPVEEKWKMETPQENSKIKMTELLRNGETFENWSEIGTMIVYKGVTGEDVEYRSKLLYEQTKLKCPNAKYTLVEMNKKIEYPWIIFSIECPISGEVKTPESQLWYIVQGNSSMYVTDRAIKKSSLPKDLIIKWVSFFKSGKIINK